MPLPTNTDVLTPYILKTFLSGGFSVVTFKSGEETETLAVVGGLPLHYCDFVANLMQNLVNMRAMPPESFERYMNRTRSLWDACQLAGDTKERYNKNVLAPNDILVEAMAVLWQYLFPYESGYDAIKEFIDDLEAAYSRALDNPVEVVELFGLKERAHEAAALSRSPAIDFFGDLMDLDTCAV